jgi:hypothetical protein
VRENEREIARTALQLIQTVRIRINDESQVQAGPSVSDFPLSRHHAPGKKTHWPNDAQLHFARLTGSLDSGKELSLQIGDGGAVAQ